MRISNNYSKFSYKKDFISFLKDLEIYYHIESKKPIEILKKKGQKLSERDKYELILISLEEMRRDGLIGYED